MVRPTVIALLSAFAALPGVALAQEPRDAGAARGAGPSPIERAREESGRKNRPRSQFRLPAGVLKTTSERLAAARQTVRFSVDLSEPVGAAKLLVRLPRLWLERSSAGIPFARVPGSRDLAGPRARLRRDGRTVAIHFTRARTSDTPAFAVQDVGIPAGTYKLPYDWRDARGRTLASGEASVVFYAPVREGSDPGPLSRMTNLRVNATNDSVEESEAFDAVTPGDPTRVAVGINSNEESGLSAWISGDGGQTWTRRTMPATMDAPGSGTDENNDMCCDPMFAADDVGNIWYGGLSLFNGPADPGPNGPSRIVVNRIGAGTTTFQAKNTGLRIRTAGSAGQDKPMMTVDNSPSSPTYGRLYVVWDEPGAGSGINVVLTACDTFAGAVRTPARCDNADNWSTPVSVTPSEGSYIYPDVAVGPEGRVYVTWWDYSSVNAIRGDSCLPAGAVTCESASNWGTPQTIANLDSTGSQPVPFACPIMAQPGGRASPAPQLDAARGDGRVYVTWSDLRAGSGTTRCSETVTGDGTPQLPTHLTWDSFVASAVGALPGGASQSASVGTRLLTDGEGGGQANSDEWFAAVAVDQTTGQAYADFYSTRDDATRTTTNFYLRAVTPAGSGHTLGILTTQSTAPSDYSLDPCCTFGNDYGDYEGLDATGGKVFPVWTDNSSAAGGDGDAFTTNVAVPSGTGTGAGGGGSTGTGGGTGSQGQGSSPSADKTKPRLRLAAKRTQRLRSRRLVVAFRANEAVTTRFSALVPLPGAARTLRLRTIRRRVAGGRRLVVRFVIPAATRTRVARSLRRGTRVIATVVVRAVDGAGNASSAKLRIRLL
jgi:hypothetical protein